MTPATAARARRSETARAVPRPGVVPRMPRRVSGPVAGRARPLTTPRQDATVGARALALVRSLPDHSLIDRLVRGRAWIPVLGVLLAGLVAMQVEILKLGTSMGRSIERSTSLQSKNDLLDASIASLADDQRIERLAAALGMVTPSPGILAFVQAHPQDQLRAVLGNIHTPDPTAFAAQLASQLAAVTVLAPPGLGATAPAQGTTGSASTTGVSGTSTAQPVTGTAGAGTPGVGTGTTGSSTGSAATTGTTTSGTTTAGTTSSTTSATGPSSGAAGLSSTSTSQSGGPSGP